MLSIDYVIVEEAADPLVVYRVDTSAQTLALAEQVARGTLDVVRRMFPATPSDGFQIFDDNYEILFRSWERVPLPFYGVSAWTDPDDDGPRCDTEERRCE